jgi:pyruvate dehydrogenase E2 component (dihydrolipoamide acetyltransferase)
MQHAKQTVPHFYLRTECVADAALALIASAKQLEGEEAPTLTDVVLRATAFALRKIPEANSAWDDRGVCVYDRVDIAVAVNTPQGLVTPVVRAADEKDLGVIARETRALAKKAREGLLTPAEYSGATFTISNLGMYGVESLYAIVNPPQSCILGVGAAMERPVVAGREVRIGTVMACTLSADHRAIDGVLGAELLAVLKAHIEQPGLMLL